MFGFDFNIKNLSLSFMNMLNVLLLYISYVFCEFIIFTRLHVVVFMQTIQRSKLSSPIHIYYAIYSVTSYIEHTFVSEIVK